MTSRIRGLSLWVTQKEAVFASRADERVCVAEILLLGTDPGSTKVIIEVRSGGDAEDLRALGVAGQPQRFVLTAASAVEVLPGLRLGIGLPEDGNPPVTKVGAQLVFNDPPHLWDIEREAFFEKKMRDLFREGKLKRLSFRN
jgi:hypothetical protein